MTRVAPAIPRVWVVVGDKAGDNAQVDAVVERLPWRVEYRRLVFRRPFVKGKPPLLASLFHVDKARSDALTPPWPDVVITVGRRPAMAALWVRRQSSDHTRIVLFGRPRRHLEHFALVIVSAQFQVPQARNVVGISLPLMRIDRARLEHERVRWKDHFEQRPRPLIAVLVGGATRPFVFDADAAADLIRLARTYCGSAGSLYVTTSRRTPKAAIAALRAHLDDRDELYEWRAGAAENPYFGLLAHADGFVVTGDSMSMITEVARLNRPLAIFPLRRSMFTTSLRAALPKWIAEIPNRVKYQWLRRVGVTLYPRDLSQVHRHLFDAGFAVPAGMPWSDHRPTAKDEVDREQIDEVDREQIDEVDRVVAAIIETASRR